MAELLAPPSFIHKKGYSLRKLYLEPENIRYVKVQVLYALKKMTNFKITMCQLKFLDDYMFYQKLKESDESILLQLHRANKEVILSTANQISSEPNMIDEKYDKEFGIMPRKNYEYSEYSFRGGSWHPEDLFMENIPNRKTNYWDDREVYFTPRNGVQPYEVFKRHYAEIENNTEDRRTEIPRPVYY